MGPDGLASMLLIETQELITYPLYLLFKKSLKDTVIPVDWKQAIVIGFIPVKAVIPFLKIDVHTYL